MYATYIMELSTYHLTAWSLIAALNYVGLGWNVSNVFAESPPPPKELFYMVVVNQFCNWWESCLDNPPMPPRQGDFHIEEPTARTP
jgi:hypothetical protein